MKFTPTMDFFSTEVRSGYVKGLIYEVNAGNDLLADLVKKWLAAGLVVEASAAAQVEGS